LHNGSTLHILPPKKGRVLQKIGGIREIILHFFLRFCCFLGFFPLQPIASQPQAAIRPLPKKSCQKHYRRFFVRSGLCHNRRVNVEMTGRDKGCKGWTAVKRRRTLPAQPFASILPGTLPGLCSFRQKLKSVAPAIGAAFPSAAKGKKTDQIRVNPGKSDLSENISAHEKRRKRPATHQEPAKRPAEKWPAPIFLPGRARTGPPLRAGRLKLIEFDCA
jgi:hypothetical protein